MRGSSQQLFALLFPGMMLLRGTSAFLSPLTLKPASKFLSATATNLVPLAQVHDGARTSFGFAALEMIRRSNLASRKAREKSRDFHVSKAGRGKVVKPIEGDAPEEISNRAKFRQTPIDSKVLRHIEQNRVCSPMGRAMRVAYRSPLGQEMREKEKSFKGFARPPLFVDIPGSVMDMIGDRKKDKLTFIAGAMAMESMPPASLPEIAFCGRSNVGKSSIINAVTLSTTARSSDKPGMTQEFNFYVLPRRLMVVDMPGYGFAFANPHKMEAWKLLFERYMQSRKSLKRVFVVIDARHGLKENDKAFLDQLERTRTLFQIVMTKCDLVHAEDLARRHTLTMDALQGYGKGMKKILMVSAYTGAGLNDLAGDMYQLSNKEQKKKVLPQQPQPAPSEPRSDSRSGPRAAMGSAGRGRGGRGDAGARGRADMGSRGRGDGSRGRGGGSRGGGSVDRAGSRGGGRGGRRGRGGAAARGERGGGGGARGRGRR